MGHIGSPQRVGHRLAIAALTLGIAAAAVGCSSGSGGKRVSLRSATTGPGTTAPQTAPTAGGATGGATGASPGSSGGGGQPSAGPTSTTRAGATGTTRPAGPAAAPPTSGPKVTTPAATGPTPASPGTYNYQLLNGSSILTTGTTSTTLAVAPQSTLVVSASGGQELWVNSTATSTLVFNTAGVFLVSETVPLATTTCTFNSPMASPPWPLVVGKTFSGQATCGQSSGTLSVQGRVIGTASVALDGATVNTFLVQSTVTLTGTSLVVAETDWYAPSLRLPVKTTVVAQGGVPGYSIASTTTYLLISARPS